MGIERHHDYKFELGTLEAGQITSPLSLPMDSDAPFVLRAIGGYQITDVGVTDEGTATLPAWLLFRYADADSNWLQSARTPGLLAQLIGTDYNPLRKHMTYPARSVLQLQFENATASTIEGIVVIFRGVKLFPGGGGGGESSPIYSPTYPDCYTSESYQYSADFSLLAGVETLNQPLYINDDADFAWRGSEIVTDNSVANAQLGCLELKIRDTLGKGYASLGNGQAAWIRAEWLMSQVPSRPGLWYPEIYVGRGQCIYYDARNTNTALTSAGQFCLDGAKVFRQSVR